MEQIKEYFTEQVKESGITKIIFEYKKLFEYQDIIEKYNTDWELISQHKNLRESFIREFQDKVIWEYILKHQDLTKSFLREFKDKVIYIQQDYLDNGIYMNVMNILKYVFNGNTQRFQEWINFDIMSETDTE